MKRRDVLKYTAYATGFAVSGALSSALLSGCKAEPTTGGFTPSFLSEEEYLTIAEMAETMLPATATPGAKELGVPEFIDLVLGTYTSAGDQERFQTGLAGFMADVQAEHGKAYTALSAEEKLAHLNKVDAEAKAEGERIDLMPITSDEKDDLFPFLLTFKGIALGGYFSSEFIGTEILAYDPVPGAYMGCIPLEENGGKAWSL